MKLKSRILIGMLAVSMSAFVIMPGVNAMSPSFVYIGQSGARGDDDAEVPANFDGVPRDSISGGAASRLMRRPTTDTLIMAAKYESLERIVEILEDKFIPGSLVRTTERGATGEIFWDVLIKTKTRTAIIGYLLGTTPCGRAVSPRLVTFCKNSFTSYLRSKPIGSFTKEQCSTLKTLIPTHIKNQFVTKLMAWS